MITISNIDLIAILEDAIEQNKALLENAKERTFRKMCAEQHIKYLKEIKNKINKDGVRFYKITEDNPF